MRLDRLPQRSIGSARPASVLDCQLPLPKRLPFVLVAALLASPVSAQTCFDPLPLLTLPFGQATTGNTCHAAGSLPTTPHPVVFHSFHAGPQLAGHFSFAANAFPDAELLLIDARGGKPCSAGAEILQIVVPGKLLDISGLASGIYHLAVTSFALPGQTAACGDYAIGHWLWDVDEIFFGSFEQP